MVRGDADLKRYATTRRNGQRGVLHRFRLALADVEALDRSQQMLAEEGVSTDRFDFSAADRGAPGDRRDPDAAAG